MEAQKRGGIKGACPPAPAPGGKLARPCAGAYVLVSSLVLRSIYLHMAASHDTMQRVTSERNCGTGMCGGSVPHRRHVAGPLPALGQQRLLRKRLGLLVQAEGVLLQLCMGKAQGIKWGRHAELCRDGPCTAWQGARDKAWPWCGRTAIAAAALILKQPKNTAWEACAPIPLTSIDAPQIFQLLSRRRQRALQLLRPALAHLPPQVGVLVLGRGARGIGDGREARLLRVRGAVSTLRSSSPPSKACSILEDVHKPCQACSSSTRVHSPSSAAPPPHH